MAYTAPELLLVGAAQQLVLQTSEPTVQKEALDPHCRYDIEEDGKELEYDGTGGW